MKHSHTYTLVASAGVFIYLFYSGEVQRCNTRRSATLYPGLRVFIKCCSLYHLSARQNYCRSEYTRRPLRTHVYIRRQFVELNVFYCGSGEKEQAKLFESCTGALDTQRENIMNAICPRSRGGECAGETRRHERAALGMRRVRLLQLYKNRTSLEILIRIWFEYIMQDFRK
jgi:hypothetical protein